MLTSAVNRALVALACTLCTASCTEADIGQRCTGMDIPLPTGATTEGDVLRSQGSDIVEYDLKFPCHSGICVAALGRPGYCSAECSRDSQCPGAFECREVMTVGPFAGLTYCVWRECEDHLDCGDPWLVSCDVVPELSLAEEVRRCGFRDDQPS